MIGMSSAVRRTLLTTASTMAAFAAPAHGQTAAAPQMAASGSSDSSGDIIVTARKRDETSISVPVALTAVGGTELQRRAISTMDGLARVVPSLVIGDNASQQGGIVAIRGLAGADTNPFGDQAVSFNIDGVQVARASIRRMSEMDIAQVEVLKGPQALFYGKNSPAGIISVHTADPTKTWEGKLSEGYEFNARESRTEGYVSGPLTPTLGVRFAGYLSDMEGWVRNIAPRIGTNVLPPTSPRSPDGTEYAGRLTLKWDPSDRFDARFKLSYDHSKNDGPTGNDQIVHCALGAPQGSGPPENCVPDNESTSGSIGPTFGRVADPRFGNGNTYLKLHQVLAGLELNYNLTDALKLSSVTGYYQMDTRYVGNFTNGFLETDAPPRQVLASYAHLRLRETTEEVRLTSSFKSFFNFMIGGLYQDSHGHDETVTYRDAIAPAFINNYLYEQDSRAYSFFGQALIDITPKLEFSGGARYSHEHKSLPIALSASAAAPTILANITGPNITRSANWHNVSPEATLTWRPTSRLTVYGSYKQGFLSGGFNANAPTPTGRSQYDQQTIKGFEAGVKALLFNGTLRTNLALYTYKTNGLQVSVTTAGTQVELRNAGSVRTKGAEFDFTYRSPIEGLTFNGAVNYNDGKYLDYQASCYRGESSSLCSLQANRENNGQVALLQDLSGTQLVRAPKWTGNIGFDYERPLSDNVKLGLSSNISHSDGYFTDVTSTPGGWQKHYNLVDASLRFAQTHDKWELALIGRNLTDKYYFVRSSDIPFTGSNPGAAPVGTLGDTAAVVSRGREVMLRLSLKFGG